MARALHADCAFCARSPYWAATSRRPVTDSAIPSSDRAAVARSPCSSAAAARVNASIAARVRAASSEPAHPGVATAVKAMATANPNPRQPPAQRRTGGSRWAIIATAPLTRQPSGVAAVELARLEAPPCERLSPADRSRYRAPVLHRAPARVFLPLR